MFWRKKREKREEKTKEEFYEDFLKEMSEETEAAEEETKKILAVVTYLADGLLVFDKNSKLSLMNPQAAKLLKIESEKVLGQPILALSRFPNFQPLISFLGGGIREVSKKEIAIKENFILEVSSVSMIVKKEKIGSLVILHDVSKEKLVERMKSEFVTLAAHQLRTPASIVKWTTRMLLDGEMGEMTREQKEEIEKAYKTNEKMIRLVDDLLNVAQIEAGQYLSKLVLSNIEEVIQSVINFYGEKIKQKNLKFQFQKSEEKLPQVMLDKEKMIIAIKNILDNAVRYTSAGGSVIISIKMRIEEIEVQIQDTGLGIPRNQQNKVFAKFFRATNIKKIDTEGTGLGLYIAKNIIEAHGGRLWFESEKGKGSTFYFIIPVKEKFGEFLTKEFY